MISIRARCEFFHPHFHAVFLIYIAISLEVTALWWKYSGTLNIAYMISPEGQITALCRTVWDHDNGMREGVKVTIPCATAVVRMVFAR